MDNTEYYLNIANSVAVRSKCVSLKVGCVLVKDDKIISTGINGTPRGYTNCCEKYPKGSDTSNHHEWSMKYEIHSEMNAILQSEVSLKGATAYCTHSPCFNCLKHLIGAGVVAIYFSTMYHRLTVEEIQELADYCSSNNVKLTHVGDHNA